MTPHALSQSKKFSPSCTWMTLVRQMGAFGLVQSLSDAQGKPQDQVTSLEQAVPQSARPRQKSQPEQVSAQMGGAGQGQEPFSGRTAPYRLT